MAKYASVLFKSLFATLGKDDNDHHRQGKHDHSQYDQFRLYHHGIYQVPHNTAMFCRDCGLVKESLAIATDIAFQVDNYDGR